MALPLSFRGFVIGKQGLFNRISHKSIVQFLTFLKKGCTVMLKVFKCMKKLFTVERILEGSAAVHLKESKGHLAVLSKKRN